MELKPNKKKILVEGFQQHDFTKNISLVLSNMSDDEKAEKTLMLSSPLVKRVKEYMWNNLPELGIARFVGNFAKDQPINMMIDADAKYISQEAEKILSDEEQTAAAVDDYFERFGPLLETAVSAYCRDKGKSQEELNNEDVQIIMDRFTTVVNEVLLSAVMQGQQFTEVYDIAHTYQTHEDFGGKQNWDATNFYNQWNHCKTAVGMMLSLDEELENLTETAYEEDPLEQIMRNTFCETLNDVDATIFRMREDGHTQAEIAKELGYKNHSAVTKHLAKIRECWDEYMDEHEPE